MKADRITVDDLLSGTDVLVLFVSIISFYYFGFIP